MKRCEYCHLSEEINGEFECTLPSDTNTQVYCKGAEECMKLDMATSDKSRKSIYNIFNYIDRK